eukprot:gene32260-16825_t
MRVKLGQLLLHVTVLAAIGPLSAEAGSTSCIADFYSFNNLEGLTFALKTGSFKWTGQESRYTNIWDFSRVEDAGFDVEANAPRSLAFSCNFSGFISKQAARAVSQLVGLRLYSFPLWKDNGGRTTDYEGRSGADFARVGDAGIDVEANAPRSLAFSCNFFGFTSKQARVVSQLVGLRLYFVPSWKDNGGRTTNLKLTECTYVATTDTLSCTSQYNDLPGMDRTASGASLYRHCFASTIQFFPRQCPVSIAHSSKPTIPQA